mmetsp:Transcript_43123/g.135972  ORF Transcript_43123/g.135972 Transcript_43123/m.135972 type:complete len:360 (+) Transcript_43123:64-1143(+)
MLHRDKRFPHSLQQVPHAPGPLSLLYVSHVCAHVHVWLALPSPVLRAPVLVSWAGQLRRQEGHCTEVDCSDCVVVCALLVRLQPGRSMTSSGTGILVLQRHVLAVHEGGQRHHRLSHLVRSGLAGNERSAIGYSFLDYNGLCQGSFWRGALCLARLPLPGRVPARGVHARGHGRGCAQGRRLEVGPVELHPAHCACVPGIPLGWIGGHLESGHSASSRHLVALHLAKCLSGFRDESVGGHYHQGDLFNRLHTHWCVQGHSHRDVFCRRRRRTCHRLPACQFHDDFGGRLLLVVSEAPSRGSPLGGHRQGYGKYDLDAAGSRQSLKLIDEAGMLLWDTSRFAPRLAAGSLLASHLCFGER